MPDIPVQLPDRPPTLRVEPKPSDVNQFGDIFGGWVMAQVDIAGGVHAMRQARGRVEMLTFVAIGDDGRKRQIPAG